MRFEFFKGIAQPRFESVGIQIFAGLKKKVGDVFVLCFVFCVLCGYEYYFVNMIHTSGCYWLLVWANSCKDVC